MSQRGRPPPRKGTLPSYSGRGKSNVVLRHGKKTLVNEKVSYNEEDELFKQFLEFNKKHSGQSESKDETSTSSQSYASVAKEDDRKDDHLYHHSDNTEVILLLESVDLKWEHDPWYLMKRYLSTASFCATSYKPRAHYEEILKSPGSVEISHTLANNKKEFNFSKAVIKKFISLLEWGISPLNEREYAHPETKNPVRFNYWDYVESFDKAFLYEYTKQKNTWFFKICSNIFEYDIPNWVYQWWQHYGPPVTFFPTIINGYYVEWLDNSPRISQADKIKCWIEGMASFLFITEFSIPWIWRWYPEVGVTATNIPCLKRKHCSKFWEKILKIDPETKNYIGQDLLDLLEERTSHYKQLMREKASHMSNPFDQITNKLRSKGIYSRESILEEYISQMQKDLTQKLAEQKTDSFPMETSSNEEDNVCLAGESQDPFEDVDKLFETLRKTLKGKSKAQTTSSSEEGSFDKAMKTSQSKEMKK